MAIKDEGYFISVDAGTGSCRAALYNFYGREVDIASKEWSHSSLTKYPNSQDFDTKNNWKSIATCINTVIKRNNLPSNSIRAISATSMREGIVLYDENGEEIWACPNVDGRAYEESAALEKSGDAKVIYKESGDWVTITSPSRLNWIKRHQPNIYKKIHKLTMLSDWVLYKLTGEFVTDFSIASSSGLLSISSKKWSQKIMDVLELNKKVLPDIYESGTMIGEVHKKASEETGLELGTPVVLGGADTQLALVGIGNNTRSDFTLIGGSFWQSTVVLDEPLIDDKIRLRTLCHSIPNKWMMEGIGYYSGLIMRWFRDAFCDYEKRKAVEKEIDAYQIMENNAKKVEPGSNGVTGIFGNIMNTQNWVHPSPSLMQYNINAPEKSGKKETIRAIMENAAYIARGHKEIIEEITSNKINAITFSGGGAKGELWPQIVADVLGVCVNIPEVKESSSLGAAIYCGIGTGIYKNVNNSVEVKVNRTYYPNQQVHDIYNELFYKREKITNELDKLVADKTLKPLS